MKVAVIFLAGLCAIALATPTVKSKTGYHHQYKVADKEFLKKQYEILHLFQHVHQPTQYKEYETYGKTFTFENNWDSWTKPEVAKEFWYWWTQGMLPKGEVFSVFYPEHLKQAVWLFKVFYYAKDWETFHKVAWWAREHVNEGMFIYSLSVAIIHRPDTERIILPPIYEIYPYYFFPSETIHEAQKYKQQWTGVYEPATTSQGSFKGYTINTNYTGWYMNLHPEQSLSYFTEDIGVNSFYYYYNLYYPFWMDTEEFHIMNPHRGEQFYYVHQQLLARYYLERLSNDWGEIPEWEWEWPMTTGYYPSMQYSNGLEFPSRPSNVELWKNYFTSEQSWAHYNKKFAYSFTLIQDYERRIRDAIDRGFVYTKEGKKIDLYDEHGFETLGDMIEANPDSPDTRFYGTLQMFTRYVLGYSYYPLNKYQVAPSVLQHFETSLRDPMFYQMFKRFMVYFQMYKSNLKPYTWETLRFPGVKVEKVTFDPLYTYFDYFYTDLSNAVYVTEKEFTEDNFHVRTRQQRMNYKPFTYNMEVTSEKAADAMVRVFIGPKHDEYGREMNITWNRWNFVEFDRFTYKLKEGKNVIKRDSHDNWYAHDYPSYQELYEQVKGAMEGKQEFHVYDHDYYYGFPNRFLLPSGSKAGTDFQFYFMVSPYHPQKVEGHNEWYWPTGFDYKYVDGYSYGYPFDRPIYDEHKFWVDNSYWHTETIYHKTAEEINAPHH